MNLSCWLCLRRWLVQNDIWCLMDFLLGVLQRRSESGSWIPSIRFSAIVCSLSSRWWRENSCTVPGLSCCCKRKAKIQIMNRRRSPTFRKWSEVATSWPTESQLLCLRGFKLVSATIACRKLLGETLTWTSDFWAQLYCCLEEVFLKLSAVRGRASLLLWGSSWLQVGCWVGAQRTACWLWLFTLRGARVSSSPLRYEFSSPQSHQQWKRLLGG